MKISIITISYNNIEGLRETIESVASQTAFDCVEYIIIDGGSNDGTIELLKQYANRFSYYVSEPDSGIYNAMNKGLRQATGDYVIFSNSGDCLYCPFVVENFIALHPHLDIYVGDTDICYEDGSHKIWKSPNQASMRILYNGSLSHQATFIKTDILKKRMFDESFHIVSDWKLFIQLLIFDNCTYQKLPFTVCSFAWGGISSHKEAVNAERQKVLNEYFPPRIQQDFHYLHFGYTDIEQKIKQINWYSKTGRLLEWIINRMHHIQHGK